MTNHTHPIGKSAPDIPGHLKLHKYLLFAESICFTFEKQNHNLSLFHLSSLCYDFPDI